MRLRWSWYFPARVWTSLLRSRFQKTFGREWTENIDAAFEFQGVWLLVILPWQFVRTRGFLHSIDIINFSAKIWFLLALFWVLYNFVLNDPFPQEGKKLDFVVRIQSAKGIPKRYTVSSKCVNFPRDSAELFSIEYRKYSGNYFGFGFNAVWDWLSRLAGKYLVWFWFYDWETAHRKLLLMLVMRVFVW